MTEAIRMKIEKVENGYQALFDKGDMYVPTTFVGMTKKDIKATAMKELERRVDLMLEDL